MASFFVNRPIVAIVISIIMTIVGIATFLGLPVAQFPNIVPPEIQVKTTYTGADALTVEQSVATPIEQQMSGVDNMNYMSSVNGNDGTLKLTVNFDVTTDPSTDQILSQMRSNQASSQLPEDVNKFGVTVQKSTSSPLIMFSLYSPKGTYDSVFLANYSYINLNDQFTRVAGIASVMLAFMLGCARIWFAISRDGLLPAWFAQVHPETRDWKLGDRVVVADVQVDSAQQTATSIGDSALAMELNDLAYELNRFRTGIAMLMVRLHQLFHERIPRIVIRKCRSRLRRQQPDDRRSEYPHHEHRCRCVCEAEQARSQLRPGRYGECIGHR
jgi:hypothetical protein